ncbi:hypothetical protein Clacol_004427 [Clathrus columnatus]|uniref:Uncharacterized protein n=1 Tax=Clathrus columnatus TaxID=1419009 RepID=A0AAV5A6E0_9AGAM|nr:hypothetical protein Clacol_004427 [Clathrus columnatus]
MSSTAATPERTTALEIQINMMANKINILEAEIERLRRDMDSKNGTLLTGPELHLPPYIFVEHGNNTVVIARQAVKACPTKYFEEN